ncbi:unnamed protein product, partial [Darwinula stevensoni]
IQHQLARNLFNALRSRQTIAPLTTTYPDITIEDAYQISLNMLRLREHEGEKVIGKKIGVTSKPVQDMLGVHQPDFGFLTDKMWVEDGATVSLSAYALIQPRAEGEIAFKLKADLPTTHVTPEIVLAATECIFPCYEIVDSRIENWQIKIQDTVADNASCGIFCVGAPFYDFHKLDLAQVTMKLFKNGEHIASGKGEAVQGHPAQAIAWLANTLGHFGVKLGTGDIVLSGSLAPLVPIVAGDRFELDMPIGFAMAKIKCAMIGSGNIGTDLMMKLMRSDWLEPVWMVGIDPESDGLARAKAAGLKTTHEGVDGLVPHMKADNIQIVFDATSAYVHAENSQKVNEQGALMIDLTPAAIGPFCVPPVNLENLGNTINNVNMVTCGGQATIPMVNAVSRVQPLSYAEIVSTVSSKSAGPGTRKNIDEFTRTTAGAVAKIGGSPQGKAIIILNPADPPLIMRNTVHCLTVDKPNESAITDSVQLMLKEVQKYVPGYRVKNGPVFDGHRVTVFLEVEGRGDYLPNYAGNLDIMTAAGMRTAEMYAEKMQKGKKVIVHDMTLRDGMHPKRHQISIEQMKSIAKGLDQAGVPLIEVTHGDGLGGSSVNYGFPMHTDEEYLKAVVPELKNAHVSALLLPGIGTVEHLIMAKDLGVKTIRVATHCTEADVSEQHISMARKLDLDTVGFLMMAHMISPEQVVEQALLMESYGANCIYCTDSAGYMLPDDVTARIALLREKLKPETELGFH